MIRKTSNKETGMFKNNKGGNNTPKKGEQGFQKSTAGKTAPITKIEQKIMDTMQALNGTAGSEGIGLKYAIMFKRFSESQDKVEKEISDRSDDFIRGKNLKTFKYLEGQFLAEATEASNAVIVFRQMANELSENKDDLVEATLFSVALSEAFVRSQELTLQYLAAVEARREFEVKQQDKG